MRVRAGRRIRDWVSAGFHRAEGVVHAVELDGLRHHGRDVEAAGLDQLGDIDRLVENLIEDYEQMLIAVINSITDNEGQ